MPQIDMKLMWIIFSNNLIRKSKHLYIHKRMICIKVEVIPDYYPGFLYELSLYLHRKGNHIKGFRYMLQGLENSAMINKMVVINKGSIQNIMLKTKK